MALIKSKNKGNLIIISGPSGVGKDTVVSEYIKTHQNCWYSVSTTSRPVRKGDVPGKSYNFVTKEEFEELISKNYFLEYAKYVGNYYGTPKKPIIDHLNKGFDVFLVIEIQGAMKIKDLMPEAVFIFLLPPNLKTLHNRLEKRGSENKEKVLARFREAYREISEVTKYNYAIVNDELEETIKKMEAILISEKCRCDRIEEVSISDEEDYIRSLLLDEESVN